MVSWPPSPFVEDETIALAHELSIESSIDLLKSDNQGALSRGSVDQYPIIIDTPIFDRREKVEPKGPGSHELSASDLSSSDDTTGPSTPPPYRKQAKLAEQPSKPSLTQHHIRNNTSNGVAFVDSEGRIRGRPPVSRIRTDIKNDIYATSNGIPLSSSPSPMTCTQTFHTVAQGYKNETENFLSPSRATVSPRVYGQSQGRSLTTNSGGCGGSETRSVDGRMNGVDSTRSKSEHRQGLTGREGADSQRGIYNQPETNSLRLGDGVSHQRSQSYHQLPAIQSGETLQPSLTHRQKLSQDSLYGKGSNHENFSGLNVSTHSRGAAKESPYCSSAEDSSRGHSRTSAQNSSDEHWKLQRKSTQRRERPTALNLGEQSVDENQSVPAGASLDSRPQRNDTLNRYRARPLTPLAGDANKTEMENYFVRAFQDNELRKSQRPYFLRGIESNAVSPMTSPPRTPRLDRTSKNYFEMSQSMQRGPQRSRQPSLDDGIQNESKQSTTLLSAATAGAAYLARSSGTSLRSTDPRVDTVTSAPNSKPGSVPHSRRPSRVKEQPDEPTLKNSFNPINTTYNPRTSTTPGSDTRPISRGSIHGNDSGRVYAPHPMQPVLPHRAMSYSGFEGCQPRHEPYPLENSSGHDHHRPQPRSARSSVHMAESPVLSNNAFTLPTCPRSQPTVGFRDWYSIREMSDVDICPTCMNAVSSTRYRDSFVPSLPRPYDQPSVCAMSRPWVRIAFVHSLRQNRPNLNAIRAITSSRKDTKPCSGDKKDIRRWFYAVDPHTDKEVPGFSVCTTCVSAIDKVFPNVCSVFQRPKNTLNEERSCSMHTESKHFASITEQLEQADTRCKGRPWRSVDVEPLIRHLWRVARYKPCPRDEMQTTRAWHFMPDLPEFTVCEECYDHVVRPVEDRSVAREISKTLKTVPARRGSNGTSGISCQLYSERMRKLFRDAVHYRDFKPFHEAVKTRFGTQQRLNEMNKLFEQDLKYGIDRRQDIERNHEIWKTFE